ncbi:variant erythrocyte surface antigen-1 family protein [Babesia caballi]|uniref:Variant erythrocyte surface antigen-1 family protein n=1 Tax=Babesia caballi TaxID=5871 RepID=A0AAV4LPY1_BABCB|nr:variant erythrocyte surface antigen-1 family protein [Babesia caballi]
MARTEMKKKLSIPPINLKEAIDWVLRVSGYDISCGYENGGKRAICDLAYAMFSNHDTMTNGMPVAVEKLFKSEEIFKSLLGDKISKYCEAIGLSLQDEAVTSAFTNGLPKAIPIWIKADIDYSDGPITEFVRGLAKFIGWDEKGRGTINCYGIANCYYESAYDKHSILNYDEGTNKTTAVTTFLDAVIVAFVSLTYLYWQCHSKKYANSIKCGEWSQQTFCDDMSNIGSFLKAAGFEDFKQLTTCSTVKTNAPLPASVIAGHLSYAFPEFSTVMANLKSDLNATYADFISALIKEVIHEAALLNIIQKKKSNYTELYKEQVAKLKSLSNGNERLTARHFPFTTLFVIASTYQETEKRSTSEVVLKTVGSLTAIGSIGVGAYITKGFGLIPALAAFFA